MLKINGDLPPYWLPRRLGDICRIVGGRPAPKEDRAFKNGTIPFVRMKDLGAYHVTSNLANVQDKLSAEYVAEERLPVIPHGAILMPRSGSVALNHRAILGVDAVIVSHICALVVEDSRVDVPFLYHLLRETDLRNITKKTTGLDAITFSDLAEIKVGIPPLPIQKQIAAILEKADVAREKRREANQLTEQYLQSAFLEMFGDPVTNPKGWVTGILSDAIEYSEYGTSVKSNDEKRGCLVIGMSNVTNEGRIDLSAVKHVELPPAEHEKLRLRPGDVIFNRTNSTELVGKTAFWNSTVDAVVASYLVKLRVSGQFNPIWFSTLLNTAYYKKLFMQRCKKAVGQSNISPTLLKEFPMYKPPLREQQTFAALVEKVEGLRAKQRESEKELDNLFQSLMQRAFRGELVS